MSTTGVFRNNYKFFWLCASVNPILQDLYLNRFPWDAKAQFLPVFVQMLFVT